MTRALALLALLASACASAPNDSGFGDVHRVVADRLGQDAHWREAADGEAERAIAAKVDALLAKPLTERSAVALALLENQRLQATFEELGIARADLVQAGLLQNPVLGGAVGFPVGLSALIALDASLTQDLLSIVYLPLRRRVAQARLAAAQERVTAAIFDLARETRDDYFRALEAEQAAKLMALVSQGADAAAGLALRQTEAGDADRLSLSVQQGFAEEARLAWARAEEARLLSRERLSARMGVWGKNVDWTLAGELPGLPAAEAPLDGLETLAVSQRFELEAARREISALSAADALVRTTRFLPSLSVGVEGGRDPENYRTLGPSLSLELPLFDQGQARLERLQAEERSGEARLLARAVEIRAEVRAARDRLLASRGIAERYRTVIVPLQRQIVAQLGRRYDAMLAGVYDLVRAKRSELQAYQGYLESVRDYWVARADLERAIGGPLPSTTPSQEHSR
ncbi:MAG: TolC family protein [Deltaproteobacteria bacterium]